MKYFVHQTGKTKMTRLWDNGYFPTCWVQMQMQISKSGLKDNLAVSIRIKYAHTL